MSIMRRAAVATALAAVALALPTATTSTAATPSESWGELDGTAHPYTGQLIRFVGGEALGGCSGELISPTVFVTAGHCAVRKQADPTLDLWVTFDATWSRSAPPTSRYRVAYAVASDRLDLGVEVLAGPVPGVEPATLGAAGTLHDLVAAEQHPSLDLVGYGQDGAPYDKTLQSYDESPRRSTVVDVVRISAEDVQTHATSGHPAPPTGCAGNSGGGLFLPGTDVLVAIVSLGDPVCVAYGSEVRLDSPAARAFLDDFVTLP